MMFEAAQKLDIKAEFVFRDSDIELEHNYFFTI